LPSLRLLAPLLALLLCAPGARAASPDALLREHLWTEFQKLPPSERPRVGLALSAGSVRGLAHVGVIQVLEDAGFPTDVVAGASMGAIVGSVYASGQPVEQLLRFQKAVAAEAHRLLSKRRLLSLMITDSLIPTKTIEGVISAQIGDIRFDQLQKPFACAAMDLRTGEKIIFRDGPVAPAVRASASLPGLFKPLLYRHRYLSDGGVVDYIPCDLARLLGADWVLASVTNNDYTRATPTSVYHTLAQVIDIRGALLAQQQRKEADFIIDVNFGNVNFMDFRRADEMVETGVLAAKGALEPARESLLLFSVSRLWKRWVPEAGR